MLSVITHDFGKKISKEELSTPRALAPYGPARGMDNSHDMIKQKQTILDEKCV